MNFSMFFQTQLSQIGYLSLDVLVSENITLPSKVTEYPVEDGNEDISDHITAGNEEITINGVISASSAFGMEFGSQCYSKMIDAIDQLRKMHKERKTFTVVTGLGKYEDMAFTNLTIDRNNSPTTGGQWLTINASLRKIRKVSLKQTDLPPDNASTTNGAKGKTGKTAAKSGQSGKAAVDPNKSAAINANNSVKEKFGLTKGAEGPFVYQGH